MSSNDIPSQICRCSRFRLCRYRRPCQGPLLRAGTSQPGSQEVRRKSAVGGLTQPLTLLDSGSNANILSDAAASEVCRHSHCVGSIDGISGALSYTSVASGPVCLGATEEDICTLSFLYTPRGRQNILSESVLLDNFGIKVHKEWPPHILFADGRTVPCCASTASTSSTCSSSGAPSHARQRPPRRRTLPLVAPAAPQLPRRRQPPRGRRLLACAAPPPPRLHLSLARLLANPRHR